jgi:glycosyltransferase involved in cell wall biosynthesis
MAELLSGVAHVHVLSHEVDFDRFRVVAPAEARSSLGLDPSRKYVLFAASPDIAVKNFPLARDAVAAAQVADPSIELLVVDRAPQEQLALYFNAVDALVFTSFQEGSPNVIKQAMACGLPIVSTDVGDVTEVIGDTNGCEIVSRDVAAVAGALRRVLAWGGRTDGRSRVEHLRGDRVATRLASIYEDVASRRKHDRAAA